MMVPKVVWAATFLLLSYRVSCKRPFLYFLDAKTSFLPEYMSQYDIKIVPRSPSTTLDIKMTFVRNFTIDPIMDIQVLMKQSDEYEYRRIFKFDIDICKVFPRGDSRGLSIERNAAKVLDVWMNNIKKYGRLPSCPITAGEYVIQNLKASTNSIPPFVLSGIYRMDVFYYLRETQPRIFTANSTIILKIKWK